MQKANLQLSVRLSLLLAALCVVFLMIGGLARADAPESAPIRYVVESGDTLWGIATAHAGPDQDVRRLVADIARLSEVDPGSIFPGQVLLIPVD
ncbi:MAG TPA: LysM peptidoglycan-binding domain-containing protein [Acidimicrobiia bacterium]|nr:LysM peptidoglycan-binding domain-containing protein [Acidimicrobiia bacterium]